jgi:glyoxylase-like metal-dependent hydrolase (beta-lactamase superfamily II)/rhodanese-related sulfurtransferase
MIFRQLFDNVSCTYTYILANRTGGEALIIDPVADKVDQYLKLIQELDVKLMKAIDTHCHADHISGIGSLRDLTECITVMGMNTSADLVSMRVEEGDLINLEGISLEVLYTPGHTDDSYCFILNNHIFTGDTLLIKGTGRTDFQNGDPLMAYDSLFNKILKLEDHVVVHPGHDYNGFTSSTIGEERAYNPRLQVSSAAEYADIMNNLNLPNPKIMDQAIPSNLSIGLSLNDPNLQKYTLSTKDIQKLLITESLLFVDLREEVERIKEGAIPNSVYLPYEPLINARKLTNSLKKLLHKQEKFLIVYCAYGERSAIALQKLLEAGSKNAYHLLGGLAEWKKLGGKISQI